jgi:hypothetical protein
VRRREARAWPLRSKFVDVCGEKVIESSGAEKPFGVVVRRETGRGDALFSQLPRRVPHGNGYESYEDLCPPSRGPRTPGLLVQGP